MQVWPGSPYPLGATYDGMGTNFSLFSEVATSVELCLFDDSGRETKIQLPEVDGFVWHGYLPNVGPGQRYGYRVHGLYDPSAGLRCNPRKLLLDPYAKAIDGKVDWHPSLFAYDFERQDERNDDDSAPFLPKAVVVNPYFNWGTDRPPQRPYNETVIYEAHVKGLTFLNKHIPLEMRGTYAGLSHPSMIEHLQKLGMTAVELMPVHQFVHDHSLRQRGLRNYWGYNTIGFFAPDAAYASSGTAGQQVQEFKAMVRDLHEAGIEVILDVVYNHTAEGNHFGPTLSMRGIDNASYYRLVDEQPEYYMDYTGTGNTLNVRHPHTLQLIMDSLRYWVLEMHVDGFRFDLAATLAREFYDVDRLSAFFDLVQQDPTVVPGQAHRRALGRRPRRLPGRQLPAAVDGVERQVPRHRAGLLARRAGDAGRVRRPASPAPPTCTSTRPPPGRVDQLRHRARRVHAARPGLVQREAQRGQRRGQPGRRVAQPVLELRGRGRDRRPGDPGAAGRSSGATSSPRCSCPRACRCCCTATRPAAPSSGNNNGYCQDNDLTWLDWAQRRRRPGPVHRAGLAAAARSTRSSAGGGSSTAGRSGAAPGAPLPDIAWFTPDAREMTEEDWEAGFGKSVAVFLNGDGIPDRNQRGERVTDDSFIMIFNAHDGSIDFTLPAPEYGAKWEVVLDTATPQLAEPAPAAAQSVVTVEARSLAVLRRVG